VKPRQDFVSELFEIVVALIAQYQKQDFGIDIIQAELVAREERVRLQAVIARRHGGIFLENAPKFLPPAAQALGIKRGIVVEFEVLGVSFQVTLQPIESLQHDALKQSRRRTQGTIAHVPSKLLPRHIACSPCFRPQFSG